MSDSQVVVEYAISRDGTPIGFRRSGHGPGLVLVHGTSADASRWDPLLPRLEPAVTVYAVDRRGRGASGDGPDYSLAAEADDLVAVIEAAGAPVDVLGHSYGALCAVEAARLTTGIRRLVLYEPAVRDLAPPGFTDRLEELARAGRREDVVTMLLRDLAGLTEKQLTEVRALPSWAGRVAAAHTVAREQRAEEGYRFQPARFAGVKVPTLMLTGTESPPEMQESTSLLASALPDVRVRRLAGQGHAAMQTAPDLFLREVLGFLQADRV
ncbi:alpha/beta fold hydrolase [Blastococcus deserti]|uniref:Alpha/beta fold hydrolase n=1 Tax=Blastococcus deserti TaxID=2259033 RepID=A0ABW4X9T3_9ACTN